jgi:prepilin-type N-terminal cleavage/methylation domain-containing protein
MAKRGFSIVELMIVVILSALVLGVTVSLYGFSMTRLAQGSSRFSTEDQARKLLDEIESVLRDSVSVSTVTSGSVTGLKCVLAQQSNRSASITSTSSKLASSADPIGVTKRGYDKHGTGKRVWFYMGSSTGAFGTSGTTCWRAERNDDTNPTTTDVIANFTNFTGSSNQRFPLVTSISFSIDSTNKTATVTVASRMLWRDERTGSATEKQSQTFTETRTIGWRHWFK